MVIKYLIYSLTIVFFSWIGGMIVNGFMIKREYYKHLSNFNLIRSKGVNKGLGIGIFKWIVKHTFFKYFSQSLKLKNNADLAELNKLRTEMTYSEISHFVGFGFVLIFVFIKLIEGQYLFAFVLLIFNVLMNLYPSLLQQQNKRRIDRLLKIVTRHN